tara:strand:- start:676 stop:960 length:285 start_codon:yes stop_codon:yes gene_type:complete
MYMLMALAEKAEIDYVLDSGDDEEPTEMSPEKQLETLQGGINELDNIRKQAVNRVNPQSVPTEVREVIEETEIPQSLLDKVEQEKNSSLLAREE